MAKFFQAKSIEQEQGKENILLENKYYIETMIVVEADIANYVCDANECRVYICNYKNDKVECREVLTIRLKRHR